VQEIKQPVNYDWTQYFYYPDDRLINASMLNEQNRLIGEVFKTDSLDVN
jgi:hypothetical protein